MIYQLTIYYGATLNNEVVYSLESNIKDCTKLPDNINDSMFRYHIEQAILQDGFNPNDFTIGYLTKEQYENRSNKGNENTVQWTVEK